MRSQRDVGVVPAFSTPSRNFKTSFKTFENDSIAVHDDNFFYVLDTKWASVRGERDFSARFIDDI